MTKAHFGRSRSDSRVTALRVKRPIMFYWGLRPVYMSTYLGSAQPQGTIQLRRTNERRH